ncbi:MAG: hypothetical protein WAV48_04595 [Candidatus Magasanikiibacteriota bacterium]
MIELKNRERAEPGSPAHCEECPYGTIGDRLWVRETFFDNLGDDFLGINSRWIYRADGEINKQFEDTEGFTGWKPSIFMPRSASRITLELTNVWVEQLWDITTTDCFKEGIPLTVSAPTQQYSILWEEINGKNSWAVNPWVWVIEFKRV